MAFIDNYDQYCIYREFLNAESLQIILFDTISKKYYQKILTMAEWQQINNNFSLKELELIIKVCIDRKNLYNLIINKTGDNIILNFVCMELIKTYTWDIILYEKTTADAKYLQSITDHYINNIKDKTQEISKIVESNNKFSCEEIKNYIKNYEQSIVWLTTELAENIKFRNSTVNKELALASYIAQHTGKNTQKLNFRKIASAEDLRNESDPEIL